MLDDLSQIEKLVLTGYFQRSEEVKQGEIKGIDLSKISVEAKQILGFKPQNFDFEVDILSFNSKSGRFVARGEDIFGESDIYGTIKQGQGATKHEIRMRFEKVYTIDTRHRLCALRPNPLYYFGWMEVSKEKISCNGIWKTYYGSLVGGIWMLSSVKEPA